MKVKECQVACPRCGSKSTVRHGTNKTIGKGERQRRKCKSCAHTFYENWQEDK